jgi:hypothetical protein
MTLLSRKIIFFFCDLTEMNGNRIGMGENKNQGKFMKILEKFPHHCSHKYQDSREDQEK